MVITNDKTSAPSSIRNVGNVRRDVPTCSWYVPPDASFLLLYSSAVCLYPVVITHSLLTFTFRGRETAEQYIAWNINAHQAIQYYAERGRAEAVRNRLSRHGQHVQPTPTIVLVLY